MKKMTRVKRTDSIEAQEDLVKDTMPGKTDRLNHCV
jgi:hypothetical protein